MAALITGRTVKVVSGPRKGYPMAASTTIFQGSLVALNASGYAVPMTTATGRIGVGFALPNDGINVWDNSAGAAGDVVVEVQEAACECENSAGGDEITIADIGKICYGVDDQTVALTSNGGARSPAGRVEAVISSKPYVLASSEISRAAALGPSSGITFNQVAYSTANATVAAPTATAAAAATFSAPVTITDSSGYTGTHDDTMAATTLPAALTDNSGGVSGGDTIAIITNVANGGSADVAPTAAAIATLAAKVAAYRTMLDIALQNLSDVAAKVVEHNTQLSALATDRASASTQITALVADDLDNRQSINSLIDVVQAIGAAG